MHANIKFVEPCLNNSDRRKLTFNPVAVESYFVSQTKEEKENLLDKPLNYHMILTENDFENFFNIAALNRWPRTIYPRFHMMPEPN